MGTPLKTPRKHMSRLELFHLMQWLSVQSQVVLLSENILEIRGRALKELSAKGIEIKITDFSIRSAMNDLGLKCATTKVDIDTHETVEILNRVKRLEKFIAKHFAEEWANLE